MNDEERLKNSIEIIERICNQYKGTLQEHQTIQTAWTNIKTRLNPKKIENKIKNKDNLKNE